MKSKNCAALVIVGMLVAALCALGISGCNGGASTPPPPPISISLSRATANIQPQATAQFTATVSNDPSGKGVTWSMTCNGATCGSISPTSTTSGATTTYTAPGPPGIPLKVILTATSVADTTKSASVAITVPAPTTVSVSPSSATVLSGGTQQFTATVGNDPENAGVTWQVLSELCELNGAGKCSTVLSYLPCSGCGSFLPASTASGTPTTYSAPAHLTLPGKPGYRPTGGLSLVATSVTYTASSANASLTVRPISVSVSPGSASVALSNTQQFTATVANDGTNSGVTWILTQNGAACSPTCGAISPTSTASGAPTAYTAPATAPALPTVTITAKSIEDTLESPGATVTLTTSTGNVACGSGSGSESLLKGQYAFLLHGFDSNGDMVIAGSISADGTGKITAGEEDWSTSHVTGGDTVSATGSSYAVGPDHRGCLILAGADGPTTYLRFALGSINSSGIATGGHLTELDNSEVGIGIFAYEHSAGTIRLQDPASFAASQFKGNYVAGLLGRDRQNGRIALAGTFAPDGNSAISSGTFDANEAGTVTSEFSLAPGGTFTCCDASGRGTLTVQSSTSAFTFPGITFYIIDSALAFLVSASNTILGGEAIGVPSGISFSQGTLNGASVLRATGRSASGPAADLAVVNADGKTAFTTSDNINNAGAFSTSSTAFTYTVAPDGRVTLTDASMPPVLYLYGLNQGFLVGTDPDVTFGILEPQTVGPFSNTSFSGVYMFGTENPLAGTVTLESGVLTADGKGNASGTSDQSNSSGLTQNQAFNFTYSIPANGVGNVGSGTTAILISGNKLVFINNTNPNPTITVVEQ